MPHAYKNIGSSPGRFLVILTPGGFENLWREVGELSQQDTAAPALAEIPIKNHIYGAAARRALVPVLRLDSVERRSNRCPGLFFAPA
jgi:hypothetical protein